MQIGPLPPSLIADAVDLWHTTGISRPWNDPVHDARRALDGPASTLLAAVEKGRLIGTAMVGHDGHRGWVYYLAVAPDARRNGVGRTLMSACETWVSEQGVPKLHVMVRGGNGAVLGFYGRLGYAAQDTVVLGKRL